jgi:hypothetical protein
MSFENQIQQWVLIDNELKKINDRSKELRNKRSQLCDNIVKHADTNNMVSSVIQISDGKIKFANTKIQEPLTFKYLEKSLSEIIKNESQVKLIIEHVKNNRNSKNITEIKRFYTN